jgi:polyhydroxyalkanoate synthase
MSNFQFSSDNVVDEVVQFNQNLSKGIKNLLEADEISSGVTPREEIYAEDKLKLFRYQPSTGVVQNRIPTLIVYALVNRPYMMDIQENRSTIRGLLDTGQDVYLIDWG